LLFRGAETVKVDDKGRLKLPAHVKTRLADRYGKDALYFVTSLTGETVLIYPLTEFEQIETTLAQAPQFDKTKDKFLFTAYRFGAEAAVDDQGRLLIPSKLREAAGMKGEVTLFWKTNHIEVYSQAKYEAVADEKKLGPEDFENLGKLGI
jgi:MraZ protein